MTSGQNDIAGGNGMDRLAYLALFALIIWLLGSGKRKNRNKLKDELIRFIDKNDPDFAYIEIFPYHSLNQVILHNSLATYYITAYYVNNTAARRLAKALARHYNGSVEDCDGHYRIDHSSFNFFEGMGGMKRC